MSLHASELNPVIEAPWLAAATLHPRTSVLKFAILKELEKFLIFFRFVPDVQPYGNYTEIFMYTALKNSEPPFCRDLNVSTTSHLIYKNNEAALNSSGYSFRAYKNNVNQTYLPSPPYAWKCPLSHTQWHQAE